MKSIRLLSVGFAVIALLFAGLGYIAGQDSDSSESVLPSGIWVGTVIFDASSIAGEMSFVFDNNGYVYNGGVRLHPQNEACVVRFRELTDDSSPIRGIVRDMELAEGTIEVTSCYSHEQAAYITLPEPLSGTWEAVPATPDNIVEAVRIFSREPADAIASGEDLFNLRCSACHGVGGVGTDIAPPFVDFYALPYDYIESRVRSGPEVMSAFSETDLPADQLADIVTYVQEELLQTGIREYSEEELQQGRELYIEKCAECHGSRGQGTNDFGPPLLIWPPYSVTGMYEGARIPLPEMGRVRVSNDELDLIAGYYILEMATGE